MSPVRVYLDTRRANRDGLYPLKLRITLPDGILLFSLNRYIAENQFVRNQVVRHDERIQLNHMIREVVNKAEDLLSQQSNWTRAKMKNALLLGELNRKALVKDGFQRKTDNAGRPKTLSTYKYTLSTIGRYCNVNLLTYDDVTHDWLKGFVKFLSGCSINTQSIHLRNLRAVFNEAINAGDIPQGLYPFRGFKIKSEKTLKRNLTLEELITLRDFPCETLHEKYRDIFMLIFYLIGINMVDLCGLKRIRNGRVEYRRSKTGTLFSIKVEPEAMAIIEKYKGKDFLVDIMDGRKDYNSYVKKINKVLKTIGPVEYVKEERGKTRITSRLIAHRQPLFPELSTYWARHTWASLAAELEIPKETISAALGHSSGSVTDIYINFNRKKIDEANRKVLDYVKKGAEKSS